MNPIFRLIEWLLREHGAFVSGLFVYDAEKARAELGRSRFWGTTSTSDGNPSFDLD